MTGHCEHGLRLADCAVCVPKMRNAVAITTPQDVADLFVETCKRLRELGATSVNAFGCHATFDRVVTRDAPRQIEPKERNTGLTVDEREMLDRLKQHVREAGNGG